MKSHPSPIACCFLLTVEIQQRNSCSDDSLGIFNLLDFSGFVIKATKGLRHARMSGVILTPRKGYGTPGPTSQWRQNPTTASQLQFTVLSKIKVGNTMGGGKKEMKQQTNKLSW